MKKIIAILLLLTVLLSACESKTPQETTTTPTTVETTIPIPEVDWMTLPAEREISATQYFVYDCETKEFIIKAKDITTKIYPASITKLFTAYVALQYLDASKPVTAGDVIKTIDPDSSLAWIRKGDVLTVEQLIAGMLLPSGNDATYVLAEEAGRAMYGENGKTVSTNAALDRFVKEMNNQAKLLGLNGTKFANPDGIHADNHYTTYADLAVIGTLILEDPIIMKYTAVSSMDAELPSADVTWKNTNAIIDPNSEYYCSLCTGLKTGQTHMAGSCLLTAFEYRGRSLIIGVFGCKEMDDRFPDTLQLFNRAVGISQ